MDSSARDVTLFTLSNGRISFSAMDFGCTITELIVPKADGEKVNVVLGYDTGDSIDGYEKGTASIGAIVGRVANRISGAEFTLDGKKYSLDKNEGKNCLHSGFSRWEKSLWQGKTFVRDGEAGVTFTRFFPDGDQGFPGNLSVSVTYSLNLQNELTFLYEAETDKATPLSMTNHSYFNLDGGGNVLSQLMKLNSRRYLEIDSHQIPTGRIIDAADSPFDFSEAKKIGERIDEIPAPASGYDHCFLTDLYKSDVGGEKSCKFGEIFSEKTGIKMEVFTNQAGVQIYSGNYLDNEKEAGRGGLPFEKRGGICFETGGFPNAVNTPDFPNVILRPDEKYFSKTVFRFSNC